MPPPKSFEFLKYKFSVWMNETVRFLMSRSVDHLEFSVFTRDSGNKVMMHDNFKFLFSSKLSKILSLKSVKIFFSNTAPFNFVFVIFLKTMHVGTVMRSQNKHLSIYFQLII